VKSDLFDLEHLRVEPVQVRVVPPAKIRQRREHFIQVPFDWLERLDGASGKTYALALHLRYLHWRNKGNPFTLANGMLKIDGIGRHSKWRGLTELERRGLICLERRPSRSPIITVRN
jgi:hypothetical protein